MDNQGWISVHREIYNNWIWTDNEPFDKRSAWIDLLLMVNHQDNKIVFDGELIDIRRGERLTSIRQLSLRWKWSNTKVKKFLSLLEKDGMIGLKITPQKATLITIANYSRFQNQSITKNISKASVKHHRNISETSQKHINNNDNKENNDNNDDKVSGQLETFIRRYNSLAGTDFKSSSIIDKYYQVVSVHGENIFTKAITELSKSNYLKNYKDIKWFVENIELVAEGKYRNKNDKTKFHNFEGETSSMADSDINDKVKQLMDKRRIK